MDKLPISISPCPIIEAIFEIRFESTVPSEAVFGFIYKDFEEEFKEVEQLPILQLPAALRSQDKNLKFAPHYKMKKDSFIIQVGPNVFSFANVFEYCGWEEFSEKINGIYSKLTSLGLISEVKRTALRYVNIIPNVNILENSKLSIHINEEQLVENKINLTAEIPHDNGASDLRLVNLGEAKVEDKLINGSVIDIDTKFQIGDNFNGSLELAHNEEKKVFFSLLTDEFLATLNPVYEEE